MAVNTFKKKKSRFPAAVSVFLGIILIAVLAVIGLFTITKLEIEGNSHYTKEEIEEILMADSYSRNSLYLSWKYKYGEPEQIPFIDTIEIEMLSPHRVKVTVYEKDIVGYVRYLGNCMYFDKEGMIVESSREAAEGYALITGLSFDHIVMHEALPVEDEEVFKTILNMTQLFKKYSIVPDKIVFGNGLQITLYFDKAKVLLGNSGNINEKILRLKCLLPDLEGLDGSLHMEEFDENTDNITFEKN